MSLDPTDRNDIVTLTTAQGEGGGPVVANFFALTALGASINVRGALVTRPQQRDFALVVDPPDLGRP